ncbi:MAG: UDP-N-acetylmuramate--L-alanine ligase [Ruminococcaceae bacterium]|nr:UDP-N-acetylmuramate--L-alanine ligase [Oscillospiraceae bacterium]
MNFQTNIETVMSNVKSLFFVGIGGISMSSLAFCCRARGYRVGGSDRAYSSMTERIEKAGMPVAHIHDGKNIEGYDALVYTGAVSMENPEMAAAAKKGIPMIYRADLLAYLMRFYKHRVGVAGMHGKSTCTSMLSHMFIHADKKPTVLSGAETKEMGGAYTVGEKNYFIFEACEYKDSFLHFYPSVSVMLNLDLDHTDYFTGGIPQIQASFETYAKLPFADETAVLPFSVANADDALLMEAMKEIPLLLTYGIEKSADYTATNIMERAGRYSFDIQKGGQFFTHVDLNVVGYHHIYGSLASAAVGDMLGLTPEEISAGLSTFEGLLRRFEYKGKMNGAEVYIDYAHHPKELKATLKAAKAMTKGRVIAFFEPHTYSRTASLFNEFAESFADADLSYFLDIYAAREDNIYGVSSEKLAACVPNGAYISSYENAAAWIRENTKECDTVMILGAGTVDRVAKILFP